VGQLLFTYGLFYKNVTTCGHFLSNEMLHETTDSQHRKMKKGRYVSASLKLLNNSNLLQISTSAMPVPCGRGFSVQ